MLLDQEGAWHFGGRVGAAGSACPCGGAGGAAQHTRCHCGCIGAAAAPYGAAQPIRSRLGRGTAEPP